MLGKVGDDAHGQLLRRALTDAGVDDALVRVVDGVPTGVASILVTPDGENSVTVSPGANASLTPDDVRAAEAEFATAGAVLLQMESPLVTVECAAEVGARAGTRVMLNLAPPAGLPAETLHLLDPLVVNRHEAGFLLDETVDVHHARLAAGRLLELGPRSAVITLGGEGAVYADGEETGHVAAPTVDVVDTTGAGDAFAGALALGLARDDSLADATAHAVRAGATATTMRGAHESFPSPAPDDCS